ncbi:hypothetical protein PAAG_01028 [Paracoccidioides lutzii Pb01]|uniref:Uncharacterized protein n=1 Tax=Paracoccidioides lutzii (strain ATCC MYA-826 / Pb01) TaxID=502779 RepID=C1GR83_PARBA|nr:hypothetical protein PAAG_01028 [Paracoccidioides lutzii Pb01]EEH38107.2 hypothetical protein PAAG_01028 [Paracoccidioides lutzii Pb01]
MGHSSYSRLLVPFMPRSAPTCFHAGVGEANSERQPNIRRKRLSTLRKGSAARPAMRDLGILQIVSYLHALIIHYFLANALANDSLHRAG